MAQSDAPWCKNTEVGSEKSSFATVHIFRLLNKLFNFAPQGSQGALGSQGGALGSQGGALGSQGGALGSQGGPWTHVPMDPWALGPNGPLDPMGPWTHGPLDPPRDPWGGTLGTLGGPGVYIGGV